MNHDQHEELKRLCVEIAARFPGRPFVVVMGSDTGMLSMGNTTTEDQIDALRRVLASFDANTAKVLHHGPVDP